MLGHTALEQALPTVTPGTLLTKTLPLLTKPLPLLTKPLPLLTKPLPPHLSNVRELRVYEALSYQCMRP
jgi:hypothetical protein